MIRSSSSWATAAIFGLALTFPLLGLAQTGIAFVQHAAEVDGTIDGSLQQMLPENLIINGSASVLDLSVPGTPTIRINGSPQYGGSTAGAGAMDPSGYQITISGNARVRHVRIRTDPILLSSVPHPSTPPGVRSVTLNSTSNPVGDFATVRDLTVNGSAGQVIIPPGAYGVFTANGANGFTLGIEGSSQPAIYSFQQLILNGNAEVRVLSPVVVVLGQDMHVAGAVGAPAHPHWLRLRFASGGLILNGRAHVFANVVAPKGAVIVHGSSELVGGLRSERLVVNGGALVRLVNEPPAVSLTSPVDGAAIASKPVPLLASASDPDGTIAKVEFYAEGVKLAEAVEPPYAAVWSPTTGSYTLTARAYDDLGAMSDSASVSVRVLPQLPYFTDFEATEGYRAGSLNRQQAWVVGTGDVTIIDTAFYSGIHSVLLAGSAPPARLSQNFATNPGDGIVFVDFFAKPVAEADLSASTVIESDVARVGFLRSGFSGTIQAFDGDGAGGGVWRSTLATKPLDINGQATSWIRLTLREDYLAKRWDLYSDGFLVAADLNFRDQTKSLFSAFSFQGHSVAGARFDSFYAGTENPVFVDADRDGIEDAWERSHGMNPAINDRTADVDGDGVSAVGEYVNGTDPTDYFNGISPVLTSLLDTSGQAGPLGLIEVRVTKPDGSILRNAPLAFGVVSKSAQLAAVPGGSANQQAGVRTDSEGIARVYITFSTYASADVLATARSSSLSITVQPPTTDTDGNGLPDLWEVTYFASAGGDATADPDEDGLTNAQEFQRGSSPADYYNGVLPQTESIIGGDGALAPDGSIGIRVKNAAGNPLANAPVTFAVKEGGHKLAATPDGAPSDEVVIRTNSSGIAKAYVVPGSN